MAKEAFAVFFKSHQDRADSVRFKKWTRRVIKPFCIFQFFAGERVRFHHPVLEGSHFDHFVGFVSAHHVSLGSFSPVWQDGALIVDFRNVVSTLEAGFSVLHFLHDFSFFHHFSLSPRKWRQQNHDCTILFEVEQFCRFVNDVF